MSPIEVARKRASVYAFLASALLPPSRERVGGLLKSSQLWSLRQAADHLPVPGWLAATDAYARFLVSARATPRAFLHPELMAEYCRLFVGPGTLDCPPYESVYRDGGCVMGRSTYDVLRIYQEAGFEPATPREPSDHIAHELRFMSCLCGREPGLWEAENIEAVSAILTVEDCFLNEHLSRWTPDFCSRLHRTTASGLYAAAAGLLSCWVGADAALPRAWLMFLDCATSERPVADEPGVTTLREGPT